MCMVFIQRFVVCIVVQPRAFLLVEFDTLSCIKSYSRDANPKIWEGRYYTHVLALESVRPLQTVKFCSVDHLKLLLGISKYFFLHNFVFCFESILANNYKCTWHETRTNITNPHEPCNGYTEVEILNYLEITLFDEICLIIKISEERCPCLVLWRFHCRYNKIKSFVSGVPA